MANFTGTSADEIITPSFVSPTVILSGQARPSNAADVINGGAGNDTIDAGGGDDTVIGGQATTSRRSAAAMTRSSDPGDGSDVVMGQRLRYAEVQWLGVAEHINIVANGSQRALTRDVSAVTMNLTASTDRAWDHRRRGHHHVGDLTGSGVKQVAINLAGADGNGDGASTM